MEYLHFEYHMEINYTIPASRCHFTIKCIPKDDERQHLLGMEISILPKVKYSFGEDSHENRQIYGCVENPHDKFIFCIKGDVEILQTAYEETVRKEKLGLYRFPHGKCKPGPKLLEYAKTIDFSGCQNDYEKCIYLMNKLHRDFQYVPNITQVYTDAEKAWEIGKGVCQDYAHIYITLLRLMGIPSRYVCGLIIGEGESHAWVEAVCNDKWIGFDPTNDCAVLDSYIKLGDGRDALDCAINRGIMWGGGTQSQTVIASVERKTTTNQQEPSPEKAKD